jgi:hypothetical protein
MKKPTPMQMRKSSGGAGSKAMQEYAKKRSPAKKPAAATAVPLGSQMGRDNFDAQYDLDTLTRAHQIKKDGKRHAAAMSEAKKKHAALKQVMGRA